MRFIYLGRGGLHVVDYLAGPSRPSFQPRFGQEARRLGAGDVKSSRLSWDVLGCSYGS